MSVDKLNSECEYKFVATSPCLLVPFLLCVKVCVNRIQIANKISNKREKKYRIYSYQLFILALFRYFISIVANFSLFFPFSICTQRQKELVNCKLTDKSSAFLNLSLCVSLLSLPPHQIYKRKLVSTKQHG